MSDGFGRNFLLLQGPHGPFFNQLGQLLDQTGAKAWRVGFNGGDAFFWSNKACFIAHTDSLEAWPEVLSKIIAEKSITDIVLYGGRRAAEFWCRDKWRMTHQFAWERVIFVRIWLCCAMSANKTPMP